MQWFGSTAVEVTYNSPGGQLGHQLLYRDREPSLDVVAAGRPWSFDGEGGLLRLVSKAYRLRLAYLFDPVLAVYTSLVEPLPHQITAVYGAMLPRQLGFLPREVSAEKRGWDIESEVPGTGSLGFIEVKGRLVGAATVTVTRNEIMKGLNKPDAFILAVVQVKGEAVATSYVRQPFQREPDFGVTSVNYDLNGLLVRAEAPG